jgi:hypothetical protein
LRRKDCGGVYQGAGGGRVQTRVMGDFDGIRAFAGNGTNIKYLLTTCKNIWIIMYMGTIISPDGRFEWDSDKDQLNMENKYPVMTDERIAELQNFKTKDYSDCPAQTPEQLKEFKPKYPDEQLYEPIKKLSGIISEDDLKKLSKDDDRVKYILREKI